MVKIIIFLFLFSQFSFAQENEDREHFLKVNNLLTPFTTTNGRNSFNFNPSDFKENEFLYNTELASTFKNYLIQHNRYESLDIDHLKKPEEYKKVWDQFLSDQPSNNEQTKNLTKIGETCQKEFPKSNYYMNSHYMADTLLERDIFKIYEVFSSLDKSVFHSRNICINYFFPEIIHHFIGLAKSYNLILKPNTLEIEGKPISNSSLLNESDFKTTQEKNLFIYYLNANKKILDYKNDEKTYKEVLNNFRTILADINEKFAKLVKKREETFVQMADLKLLNQYIFLIASEKENALLSVGNFIANKKAQSKEDFYQKLYFSCTTIHCPQKFLTLFLSKLKSQDFTQFGIKMQDIGNLKSRHTLQSGEDIIYEENAVKIFLGQIYENVQSLTEVKDLTSKNHRIGYLEPQFSSEPEYFEGPEILIFDRPSWEGEIKEVAHYSSYDLVNLPNIKHTSLHDAFNLIFYKYDGDLGITVIGKDGEWLNAGTKKIPKWVHISQLGNFYDGLEYVKIGNKVYASPDYFYDNFKGKPVSKKTFEKQINGPIAEVLEQKWSEETLWLKVRYGYLDENEVNRLYEEREQKLQEKELNPDSDVIVPPVPEKKKEIDSKNFPVLWIPVGNEDGSENVNLNYVGC